MAYRMLGTGHRASRMLGQLNCHPSSEGVIILVKTPQQIFSLESESHSVTSGSLKLEMLSIKSDPFCSSLPRAGIESELPYLAYE